MVTLAAHQPNLVPWMPFFEKLSNADIHVHLINVQFEKNNFQNRFQLDSRWQTLSVYKGMKPIKDKKYVNPHQDWETIIRKNPNYSENLKYLEQFISESLIETNIKIIEFIALKLQIKTQMVLDFETPLKATDKIIDLCKVNNADTYLSGPSGKNYLEIDKFSRSGIELKFFNPNNQIKISSLDRL